MALNLTDIVITPLPEGGRDFGILYSVRGIWGRESLSPTWMSADGGRWIIEDHEHQAVEVKHLKNCHFMLDVKFAFSF